MAEFQNAKSRLLTDNLKKVNKFLAGEGVKPVDYNLCYGEIYLIIDRTFDRMDFSKYNAEQYLYNIVKEAVNRCRQEDQSIYIPRDMRTLAWKVKKEQNKSFHKNGTEDSLAEIAESFGLEVAEVYDLYALAYVDSLDRSVNGEEDEDSGITLGDTIALADRSGLEGLEALRDAIRQCCAYLLRQGKVKPEDVRCFLALYSPEDVREGWHELDELIDELGYKNTQALGYHIRLVRDAMKNDIVCYRYLSAYARGGKMSA